MFVCAECGASQPAAGRCPADGATLSTIGEDVLLGTTIGVYRVARLLGIGGMGRVYKGVHPTIGSRVAIKVLSRECSDRRDLVDRFFAEAKAVNLIRHEGIVNVLDLAMLPDGRPYIIMEYLDGAPLASLIEHGIATQVALPLGGVARMAAEVLDALGAAHAKGIVHRDLKPDNVYIAPSGRPKVLDFGIAKLSDVNNASTRTGSLLGTPHYMSPEQAAGRVVDHRADIYAIGVLLFECATGRKPFLADALFDLLKMHVEVAPPSPRALRPDMPPELEHVILTALAKAPDHRFATAMAMSVALQHATAQLAPDQWRPLTPPSPPGGQPGSGASWAPTPPASWSGQGSRPPQAAPSSPPPGNISTVSAGQVTRGVRPAASKKSLWIALAAVALVGGGIAAAVAGIGGGPTSAVADPPAGAAGAPGAGATPPGAGATPPGAGATPPGAGATPPAAGATPPAAGDVGDPWAGIGSPPTGAPDPGATTQRPDPGDDPMTEALQEIDTAIKALPAAQQKQLGAYRDLAKLPPEQRMKKLRVLAAQGAAAVEADDSPGDAVAPTPPTTPGPGGQGGPAQAGWITSHDIDPPAGYDPEHLDVAAFIPWAVAQARKAIPDAQLIRIDTNGVSADGRANLKLPSLASDHGSIDVRFISPSRGKRDPGQPLGVARRDFRCEFRIEATPSGVEVRPIDFADCSKEHVVPPPRCSFAAVWKKAIKRKAPSRNAVGNVDYRSNGSKPVWYFAIGSGFDVAFSGVFGDDC
jgi:serine/threonine protein kinase